MKVVMVTPYLPPRLGGREYWVHWMSRELAAQGIEVTVFAANVSGYHQRSAHAESVEQGHLKIHRSPVLYDVDKYSTPVVLPPFRALRNENPDIVHVHEPNLFLTTPLAFYAKFVMRRKLITHCHSDPFDWYKQGWLFKVLMWFYSWLYKFKLRISDHILVVSSAYLENSRYLPRYREKITVWPMFVAPVFHPLPAGEIQEFKATELGGAAKVVLYVGRLDYRKGIDYLIRAMQEVDARCVLVGAGEKRTEASLRALVAELGLQGKVDFAGRRDQSELNKYYQACDFLVLPTSDPTSETFGTVLIEAWAAGKPVISVNNPAPAAMIRESGGGLLVNREDDKDLARAMRRLLLDGDLAAQMGLNGLRYVQERFTLKASAYRLIELYRKLLSVK